MSRSKNKRNWLFSSIMLCIAGFEGGYSFSRHLIKDIYKVFYEVMTKEQRFAFKEMFDYGFEKWYFRTGIVFAFLFWACGMCVFFLIERLKEAKDE